MAISMLAKFNEESNEENTLHRLGRLLGKELSAQFAYGCWVWVLFLLPSQPFWNAAGTRAFWVRTLSEERQLRFPPGQS